MGMVSRRSLLRGGMGAGLLLATGAASASAPAGNPFTLGVASGEPAPDGFVLWTRLATDPLAADGLGGLGRRRTPVDWELAADERFRRIERRGTVWTGPELGHSVHVELAGLAPGREFHYRFRARGELSPPGRTRTAPAPTAPAPLRFCAASCAQFEHGYFTAYARIAQEDPDLVLHLGDYLYEEAPGAYALPGGSVRAHVGGETVTLADYRRRHAQYRSDLDLQAAHAVAPWLVVWDDHELEDDWAGDVRDVPTNPPGPMLPRKIAAFRAYWENMPLRAAQRPAGPRLQLYRRAHWGTTATVHLLDTRQYRDDQPCGDALDCVERTDPARTMTGPAQERWLAAGFRDSRTRWDLVAQQVFFAQVDMTPGPGRGFNTDTWDGYPASRDRVVDSWVAAGRTPVLLTGDIHSAWAADVRRRWDDPEAPTVGTELVTTSISSGGDGSEDGGPEIPALLEANPHLHFFNNRRGYLRVALTERELTADFRALPAVQRRGAPAQTRATFRIEPDRPGAHRA